MFLINKINAYTSEETTKETEFFIVLSKLCNWLKKNNMQDVLVHYFHYAKGNEFFFQNN